MYVKVRQLSDSAKPNLDFNVLRQFLTFILVFMNK